MPNKAVVVGALGVIGRYIVERLIAAGDWHVTGLSRRGAPGGERYRHIAVGLLDLGDANRQPPAPTGVSHVFYAAFQAAAGAASDYAANTGPNRDMLVNAVSALDRASRALRRVVLVTGTKYYGVHLGALKTPMRETDPRHAGVN